ncbi:MAG TPA: hypothetical protein VKZ91_01845 [Woeseiaceae bacterium]|nr:hypothetical protein [Woeseiaceae bacterium]
MSEPPEKSSSKPIPMTDWLSLMLAEIERKEAEARAAELERQRREDGSQGASAQGMDQG